MVAIHIPQYEPDEWLEPQEEDPRRHGLDVGIWPNPPAPLAPPIPLRRPLPDRATRIRRRRLTALVLLTVVGFAVVSMLRWTAANVVGDDSSPQPITTSEYVVQPGDTLWTIAERVAPGEDPRPIVDELRERNGDSDLQVGDRLDVADLG